MEIAAPQGNSEALCAALKDLIEDEQKRLKIGEAARSPAIQHYDWRSLHVENDRFSTKRLHKHPASRNIAQRLAVSPIFQSNGMWLQKIVFLEQFFDLLFVHQIFA